MTPEQLKALMDWARAAAREEICIVMCSQETVIMATRQEHEKRAQMYRAFGIKP